MTEIELYEALCEKVNREQQDYTERLKSLPPEEILNHGYEYSVREDIVFAIVEDYVPLHHIEELLKVEDLVTEIYKEFVMKGDDLDRVLDSIESYNRRFKQIKWIEKI